MRRNLYRGLLGGVDAAVAWGLARQIDQARRHSLSRQRAHAIQIWEGEGGSTPDRPPPACGVPLPIEGPVGRGFRAHHY